MHAAMLQLWSCGPREFSTGCHTECCAAWKAPGHEGPGPTVQVTVLSIAALRKVSKGTKILLLDRNGGQSKAVAKALAKKGFNKVQFLLCCCGLCLSECS